MKKLLSVFMTFVILSISIFALPFSADAATYIPSTKIYADAYMLINLDDESHPVVAEKNSDKKKYPASLTKIVTAIVAINNVKDLKATTTVSQNAIESLYGTGAQVAGLKIGSTITIEQLLYLVMVHSACDACNVLAEYVSGDVPSYVKLMNDWVKSIGCKDTNFVNCDGLHDDNHYTTASDLAKITLEAIKNEEFNNISSTQQYEYDDINFVHTNFMLDRFHVTYYYEYAKGIKTGSTSEAGYCVITRASKDGYNYLAIVLDSPIKKLDGIDTKCSFIDAKSLFEWAFDTIKYSTVIRQNDLVHEVPIINGKDVDSVQLVAKEDVTTLVPASLDPSAVFFEPVDAPEQLEAPITKGDKICTANIIYADQIIATVDLVAAQTVELSTFLKLLNVLKKIFTNKFVLAALFIILLIAALYFYKFIKKVNAEDKRIKEKRAKQEEIERRENDDYLPPPRRR